MYKCTLKILALLIVLICVFTLSVNAVTVKEADAKKWIDAWRLKYPEGKQHPYNECYDLIAALSKDIFGHGLPHQASNHYQFYDIDKYNYKQVGNTLTVSGGTLTEASLKTLFSAAKCGDVVQMDYTPLEGGDTLHVMMVYSVSSTGVVFYHGGRYKKETKESGKVYFGASTGTDPLWGTTGNELTWEKFKKYLVSKDDGISLYRSKNMSDCPHTSYDGVGVCENKECNYQFPYDNGLDTTYAGTYKVKSGATAYIRTGPYQKCTEVTRLTSGNVTVVGRVYNCKNNYWYKLDYNGKTCYCVAGNLELVHKHAYSWKYEAAHPHKQYKVCDCGVLEYTGNTQKVSGCTSCYPESVYNSKNPNDYSYPERSLTYTSPTMKGEDVAWVQAVLYQLGYSIDVDGSYGKNTVATIKQFQTDYGLSVDGNCGPITRAKLLELWEAKNHTHYYSFYGEAAHPHKQYKKCSCGDIQYTGSNYASWEETGFDEDHPHKKYRICWCFYKEYTGEYETVSTCSDCRGDVAYTADHVVSLLLHISMPDMFPLTEFKGDFTGDGFVTTDDAVKLLLHISMPDMFPL